MSVTVVVLVTGVMLGVALLVSEALFGRGRDLADPADPAAAEHWLVRASASQPRLRRAVERADRRVLGGIAVALSFAAVFAAALVVGWIFDSIDSGSGVARWDRSVAEWGPDNATTATATFMSWVTRLGDTWLLLSVMTVVGIVSWRRSGSATSAWFLVVVGVGVTVVNNGLKLLIMRERPPVDHLVGSAGSSFPSGHSAASAACWMAVALVVGRFCPPRFRPLLAVGAVVIAGFVAASRALLGVHWVSDVVAGLAVGWTWFLVVAVFFGGRLQRFGEPFDEIVDAAGEDHVIRFAGSPVSSAPGTRSEEGRHGN